MRMCVLVLFGIALGGATPWAEPLRNGQEMTSHATNSGVVFAYRWADVTGALQTMQFMLNQGDIERGSQEFLPWDARAAEEYAYRKVKAKGDALSGAGLVVDVGRAYQGYDIRMRGPDTPQTAARAREVETLLPEVYRGALVEYGKARFYTVTAETADKNTIAPDHAALVVRYTAAMGPVAGALKAQVLRQDAPDIRTFMDAALGWLQSIPYDRLQDRYTSNGAGFQTPYGLIQGNKGDCDTKAVAFLALVRAAYPAVPLAMVYVPTHAFVGVGVPQGPRDFALATQEGTFVLADPTGPARQNLGDISPDVQADLRQQHTKVVVVR